MRRHFRNASWSGFSASFKAVYGLLNALLAVRLLGVEGYGHVATLLSLFVLYLSLNSSIFTMLVVKLMAMNNYDDANNRASVLAASVIFICISLIVLTTITLVMGMLAPSFVSLSGLSDVSDAEINKVVLLMGILTALQILAAFQSTVLESIGRLDLAMKWQLIGPVIVLAMLLFSFLTKLPITASDYVMVLCAGALTDLCLVWLVRRNAMPLSRLLFSSRNRVAALVNLLKSGGLLQATSLMNMFLEPLNKLLLNHFLGASAVTLYDLAMKIIWGIQNLFSAAMRVFLHIGSQDHEAVGPGFSRVISLVGVPMVILHIIGALFLSFVAHYWVAIDAVQLMTFFAIATVSNLGMIYVTPLYISLIGRGDLHFIFRSQAILAITNFLVSLILIPSIGLIGSAFGLFAATAYNATAIVLRCKHHSSRLDGLGQTLREARIRYVLTVSLFVVAILWGISGSENFIVLVGILLGITMIAAREPIVGSLIERIRFRL